MTTSHAEGIVPRPSTLPAAVQWDCDRSESRPAYRTRPLVARDPSGALVAGAIRIPLVTSDRKPQARSPFIPLANLTAGERGMVRRWLLRHHPRIARQLASEDVRSTT